MTKPVNRPYRKPGRPRPDDVELVKISLQLDPDVLRKFDRWSKRHGLTRSAMVRRIMRGLDFSSW